MFHGRKVFFYYKNAMTPTTAASTTTTSLPITLADKTSASPLNAVDEALGVVTVTFAEEPLVNTVVMEPTPVPNGALVTTCVTLVDPAAMELPVELGKVVIREPEPDPEPDAPSEPDPKSELEPPCPPALTVGVAIGVLPLP